MSMTTIRNIPTGVWLLWVVLLLVPTVQVNAVVSVYPPDAGDSPHSVLSTRIITDDGGGKTRFVNKDHIVWVEPDDA